MSLRDKAVDWEIQVHDFYVPISYQGKIVGFIDPKYVKGITQILNQEETVKKALKHACLDLLSAWEGDPSQVKSLMKKYVSMARKPRHGTLAIAQLLKERQKELDIANLDFIRFCDSYKLSPDDLQNIYDGKPIGSNAFPPLCRILGKDTEELIAVLEGDADDDDDELT